MSSSDNDLLRQLYADLSSINVDSLGDGEESDDEEVLRLKEQLLYSKETTTSEHNSQVENYLEDESEIIKYQLESSEYLNRYFNDVPAENYLKSTEILPEIQLSSFIPSQNEHIISNDVRVLVSSSLDNQENDSQEIQDLLDSLIESIEYLALFSSDFPVVSSSPQPVVTSLTISNFDESVKNLLPIPDETPRLEEYHEQIGNDMMFLSSSEVAVPSVSDERKETDEKARVADIAYESHLQDESVRARNAFEEERLKNEERKMKRQLQMMKALQENKSASSILLTYALILMLVWFI
jgi:hypothetical protein